MTEDFIQLEKKDLLRLQIKRENGESTGEVLEFNLADIELPLKYQELLEKDKKNKENLRNLMLIIDKREDVKGKKLLTKNEEDKIKAINEFLKRETEVYNMFLGENGVQKLLDGEKLSWDSLYTIDKIIEKQILPKLQLSMGKITEKIKAKYAEAVERNKELLK